MRTVLVTGSSGFIGYHLCRRLLADGFHVIGIDNLSDYYDVGLKQRRQTLLQHNPNFVVINEAVETPSLLMDVFRDYRPDYVVHLAAQAGVRYSIENPRSYLESNLVGTFELLEAARAFPPQHLLLASTSSVYGANEKMPYRETDKADHQLSFYAATKKATEAMAHSYAHLFALPTTMFRFFTVYGPWGRPDMALFKFTKAILRNEPIDVYNYGDMRRDFTYIDDLIQGIRLLLDAIPHTGTQNGAQAPQSEADSQSPVAPFRVVNIGNSQAVQLTDFIAAIEQATGRTAIRNLMPMQAGDVPATWADASLIRDLTGYTPSTPIAQGVRNFVAWYRDYYRL
ncbi:NAD-dependent epimerase/dehydratase family protein [Sphingobium scionense]|uniref:UDP-glucuronate 4-epimerase n=1 Tax=Sphingobium scionense TaxID=1404341 RepID=A0A7W6LTV6_9SPHN|nr:NAD-dependent epimerase/dehydratase family protein [Sphingobium scionense]MBB4150062.1 UDP-glucuronate 4-epimerase [Sphingobium scionense]